MVSFTVFKGSKEGSIVEGTTTREIRADEVLVKVTHSGVCGTDEHRRHTDMVLGHEGVGIIEVSASSLAPKIAWPLIVCNRKSEAPSKATQSASMLGGDISTTHAVFANSACWEGIISVRKLRSTANQI